MCAGQTGEGGAVLGCPLRKRDGGGKASQQDPTLSRKQHPLQLALPQWSGWGQNSPECPVPLPGQESSTHFKCLAHLGHKSPTSLLLLCSRGGALSTSRLLHSCCYPGRRQSPRGWPTAALVSAPDLSCSSETSPPCWPLGPLVTPSLPGPPGVFPSLGV